MSGRVQIFHNKTITSATNPLPVTVVSGGGVGGLTDAELRASPVPVSATDLDIRNLVFATDKVDASGSSVSVSNLPAVQPVSDNGGSLTVDGTVAISGTVPVSVASLPLPTGAATAALQTQPGVDIGDVTINNGAGASAVNIQDGGNIITVDGTVSATQSGTWNINNVSGAVSLPTGASTETTLSSLNSKVTACNTGAVVLAAGTANIGDVDVLTLPSIPAGTNNIGDVDILTIAAGTTRVGGTYDVGGQLIDEVPTVRTVNRAFVNASATGNTSLVAAQGVGVRIRVLGVIAVSTLANNVKFQSATTDISALFPLAANAGFVLPYNQHGWFQTAANEALNVNLSVATATGFQVIWVQAT